MDRADSRPRDAGAALVLALLASLPCAASAGQGVWSSGGPYGGYVTTLALDPGNSDVLYAGANLGGVFKSTDGGAHWSSASTGLTPGAIKVVVVDPAAPSHVYAAGDSGVCGSTDAGRTWKRLGSDVFFVESLARDPASPSVLYAGTWTGVFRSADLGKTWGQASEGLTGFPVKSLVFKPGAVNTIYAGTMTGIFRSTDSGAHWTSVSAGLPQDPGVYALAVDPVSPSVLYAGLNSWGVFKSTDGGISWIEANAGLPGGNKNAFALAIDPASHDTLYVGTFGTGLFKSTDAGAHWTLLETNASVRHSQVNAVVLPSTPGRVFVGTETGVFKSKDSGSTFTASSYGLTARSVNALAVAPTAPATTYAGTDVGIFRSSDGGASWAPANAGLVTPFFDPPSVWSLAVDPSSPATVYAGPESGGIYKSVDSGNTWSAANQGMPDLQNRRATSLAIDPRTPSTIYASLGAGIFNSGVFKSTDGGGTWAPAGSGLGERSVMSLAIDPATPSKLYAGTDAGFFRSDDSAGTWTASPGFPTVFVSAVVVDPVAPGTIYAGTDSFYLKSSDFGVTWTATSEGPPFVPVQSLAADPARTGRIYAGTFIGAISPAVFRSDDAGDSWRAANVGLLPAGVMSLAVDPSTATLYAGLWSGSVWQSVSPRTAGFLLPSSARAPGAGESFYTTDLTVANVGEGWTASLWLTFLGHDRDGSASSERKIIYLPPGTSTSLTDVLGTAFSQTTGYGAIEMTSESPSLRLSSRTSTAGFGGTFGQSLAPVDFVDLIPAGSPRSLLGIREGNGFRTNLGLASEAAVSTVVDAVLVSPSGETLAVTSYVVPPRGMTQINRVVRDMGVAGSVSGVRLFLSTATPGASWTCFASVIDEKTNDATAVVPQPTSVPGSPPFTWLLPASAHATGLGGASYVTNLVVANVGAAPASFSLTFLGHDVDGGSGPTATFELAPGRSVTYADVLESVFGETSSYGAIRVRSDSPSLNVVSVTATHGFGGSFGQTVAAVPAADLIPPDSPRSVVGIREGDGFRSNLALASISGFPTKVDTTLFSEEGGVLATKTYTIPANGMIQVNRIARDMGASSPISGGRLQVSSSTQGAAFAVVASVIDETTNDSAAIEAH